MLANNLVNNPGDPSTCTCTQKDPQNENWCTEHREIYMNILLFHNSDSSECYPVLIISSIDFTPQESQYFTD